ncbi:MAG: sugar transferase [Deltaproteobacteria bacterium]|nr:sugar transferase [Deltaproteobacteria bacterium]MCL5792607.1 sugar transferase [Deltaproteobacteria bacterium]
MKFLSRLKLFLLVIGDIVSMYISLTLMLLIRYRSSFNIELFHYHLLPFTLLFIIWLGLFYITGFYDLKNLKNNFVFKKDFSILLSICLISGITFFYLIPVFRIAPKTNMAIFFIIFGIAGYGWRYLYNEALSRTIPPVRVSIIGNNSDVEVLINYINLNPQLGYSIERWIKNIDNGHEPADIFIGNILQTDIELLVIPSYFKRDKALVKLIYDAMLRNIDIIDISTFYEEIFSKIPISELEEAWLIENLRNQHYLFDELKRPVELVSAILLLVILFPLMLPIAIIIKITSKGNIIYRQKRIGRYEKEFMFYKFRTMIRHAEKDGPRWAEEDDTRVTLFGRILRYTHIDELPQLINIIKGELSFVGPRPERPEFVRELKSKIPFYEIRHIVKPGITGWAQINYRYAASIDETYEKLQYDIYYLKRRSMMLDILILIKTIKTFFINPM